MCSQSLSSAILSCASFVCDHDCCNGFNAKMSVSGLALLSPTVLSLLFLLVARLPPLLASAPPPRARLSTKQRREQ